MAHYSRRPSHSYPRPFINSFIKKNFLKTFLTTGFLCAATLLSGCQSGKPLYHRYSLASPNGGIVVADEPQAAIIGRDILSRGGNAVDAATASAFALGVTLPSRASLGAGGACLVSRPGEAARAFMFLPRAGTGKGDRPGSIPMMARGLYQMQLRYGNVQFADLLTPAISLAQHGITVSDILAHDIAIVHIPLSADSLAVSIFSREEGGFVQKGDLLTQSHLTSFLTRLKLVGVGDLYNSALSDVFTNEANNAGAGFTREDFRNALPQEMPALSLHDASFTAYFLPPPADGGIGVAMAYKHPLSAQEAVNSWRHSGMSSLEAAENFIHKNTLASNMPLPALPASTSLVVSDHTGMAVACNFSENNLFGTGRIAGSTGVIIAASPQNYPKPLYNATLLQTADPAGKFVAALASSGQNDAAQETANAMRHIAARQNPRLSHTKEGHLTLITCEGRECQGSIDAHGYGLATDTETDAE